LESYARCARHCPTLAEEAVNANQSMCGVAPAYAELRIAGTTPVKRLASPILEARASTVVAGCDTLNSSTHDPLLRGPLAIQHAGVTLERYGEGHAEQIVEILH